MNLLSTTWVYGEYERGESTYQQHLRIIDTFRGELDAARKEVQSLTKELAELKARYTALHRRQFTASKKKQAGPECRTPFGSSPVGTTTKRGAPFGHPGWTRKPPSRIDRTEQVSAPDICPHCSSEHLVPTGETKEHIQEDIVLVPRTIVTKYVHETAYCPRCARIVTCSGDGEIPGSSVGPTAKAAAVWLRYGMGISYRKVQAVFSCLFGMEFAPASLVGFDRQALRKGTLLYDDIREKLRASPVLHADETSWRNDGIGHWAWYAGNPDLAYFEIAKSRSTEAAKSIVGSAFGGTLVTDRYAAYNGIAAASRQFCLAHIIRRAKELSEEIALIGEKQRDRASERFLSAIARLFTRMCTAAHAAIGGTPAAEAMERSFANELGRLCKKQLAFKPAETLRAALSGKDSRNLFTFLRIPGVPPTNNHAEQSIRSMVLFRKTSFGTRSPSGIKTHSVLPSLIRTAQRQGRDPAQFLRTLFTEDTATAQRALYRNTS